MQKQAEDERDAAVTAEATRLNVSSGWLSRRRRPRSDGAKKPRRSANGPRWSRRCARIAGQRVRRLRMRSIGLVSSLRGLDGDDRHIGEADPAVTPRYRAAQVSPPVQPVLLEPDNRHTGRWFRTAPSPSGYRRPLVRTTDRMDVYSDAEQPDRVDFKDSDYNQDMWSLMEGDVVGARHESKPTRCIQRHRLSRGRAPCQTVLQSGSIGAFDKIPDGEFGITTRLLMARGT